VTAPAITHRPDGDGHPYTPSADQRWPVQPVAGEPVRLGAVTAGDVRTVVCEWAADDGTDPVIVELVGTLDEGTASGTSEGHLADLQTLRANGDPWAGRSPVPAEGTAYRYRFTATGPVGEASTPWFVVRTAGWRDTGGRLSVGGVPGDHHPKVVPGSVQWLDDGERVHRVRFALRLEPGDHVVGFGERFDAVDQRGRRLDAVVFEQYKGQAAAGRTYLPMPFAHVIAGGGRPGWGFHVRTSRRTWYDVGAGNPSELWVEANVGPDVGLDVAIYEGTPSEVLDAFLDETGRAEPLPDWVFRLWVSGNEWNTQATVTARVDTHRDLDIPAGVVVIEAWSDEQGITIFRDARYPVHPDGAPHTADEFTYPPDGAWPDPAGMVQEFHERGIKVILWQIPLLRTRAELPDDLPDDAQVLADGRAMVATGHAVRNADGSPYLNPAGWYHHALMADLTTQSGRDWWTAKRRYLLDGLDIDGFKTDGGEQAWGDHLRFGDGSRGDEGNNRFPVHYARAFGDLLRSAGKAPVSFSRSGFTGSQSHGIVWAGDEDSTWEAFRASITAGITASACGIVYWAWDLAGFSGPVPTAELYLRAAAAATFMPVMQYHSEYNHHRFPLRDRTPWNIAEQTGNPTVIDVFRRYMHLRERLVPYLSEQAAVAIRTGRPLMRGLFVDHPDDEATWRFPYQFGLGDDLLICPVVEPGATSWAVHLPPGAWVDVWTGERLRGGHELDRAVSLDTVPVHCRAEAWPRLQSIFRPAT